MEKADSLNLDFKDVPIKVKGFIKEALEYSQGQIFDEKFKMPEGPTTRLKKTQQIWQVMTSTIVSAGWRKRDDLKIVDIADELESALKMIPSKKLVGFHLNDKVWPVRDLKVVGQIPTENHVYLNEEHLRKIYVECGGDKDKAETMFPSPLAS